MQCDDGDQQRWWNDGARLGSCGPVRRSEPMRYETQTTAVRVLATVVQCGGALVQCGL